MERRLADIERKTKYYDLIAERFASENNMLSDFEKIENAFHFAEVKKNVSAKKDAHRREVIVSLLAFAIIFVCLQVFFRQHR